jgi:hypothetical protein
MTVCMTGSLLSGNSLQIRIVFTIIDLVGISSHVWTFSVLLLLYLSLCLRTLVFAVVQCCCKVFTVYRRFYVMVWQSLSSIIATYIC